MQSRCWRAPHAPAQGQASVEAGARPHKQGWGWAVQRFSRAAGRSSRPSPAVLPGCCDLNFPVPVVPAAATTQPPNRQPPTYQVTELDVGDHKAGSEDGDSHQLAPDVQPEPGLHRGRAGAGNAWGVGAKAGRCHGQSRQVACLHVLHGTCHAMWGLRGAGCSARSGGVERVCSLTRGRTGPDGRGDGGAEPRMHDRLAHAHNAQQAWVLAPRPPWQPDRTTTTHCVP